MQKPYIRKDNGCQETSREIGTSIFVPILHDFKSLQMKSVITILVCLTSLITFGQTASVEFDGAHWNAPYTLAVPFGWGVERSLIQKEFAPQVPFKGIEDIRFAPGWGNANSEQYWSYGFLWYLDESPTISGEVIEKNLTAYYTEQLAKEIQEQKIPARKILPVKTWITELASQDAEEKTYYGAIAMLDYMVQKPISLNCIVHVKMTSERNKTFLFFEVSPQPLNDKVWQSLDQLWQDFDAAASQHKSRLSLRTYLPEPVFGGS